VTVAVAAAVPVAVGDRDLVESAEELEPFSRPISKSLVAALS
jgi:hypothetical protein